MAEGWAKFEKVCTEMGAGELPQLLQYVKLHMTPIPTPTPTTLVKQEMKEEQKQEPMDVGAVKSEVIQPIIEKPIHISLGGGGKTVEYRCGNCNITPRSKVSMDAHIRSVHTKKALLCSFCVFSMYNFDSLNRHIFCFISCQRHRRYSVHNIIQLIVHMLKMSKILKILVLQLVVQMSKTSKIF